MRNAKLRSGSSSGISLGKGISPVLIGSMGSNDPNHWQHLIKKEDLAGDGVVSFVLGYGDPNKKYSVCIPSIADLPELESVIELRFFIYGGSGFSRFSDEFNGLDIGSNLLGADGLQGAGCLIARKVNTNDWVVTRDSVNDLSGRVLQGWAAVSSFDRNLLGGIDLSGISLSDVVIEIKDLYATQVAGTGIGDNVTLMATNTGKGGVSYKSCGTEFPRYVGTSGKQLDRYNLHDWGTGISSGSYKIEFNVQESRRLLGVVVNGLAHGTTFNSIFENKYIGHFANHPSIDMVPSELWLSMPRVYGDPNCELSYKFRVLLKG